MNVFIFQSEICTSNRSSGCKGIDIVSEELKSIYHSEEIRIVEDVGLTVDVVEKIVTNISPENVNKTPEVRKPFRGSWSYTVQNLLGFGDFYLTL